MTGGGEGGGDRAERANKRIKIDLIEVYPSLSH